MQRKYYKIFLPIYRRLKEILLALFKGWRQEELWNFKLVNIKFLKLKKSQIKTNLVR
jgi:hypothetical protein